LLCRTPHRRTRSAVQAARLRWRRLPGLSRSRKCKGSSLMLALPADTRPAKYCRRAEASVRNNMPLKGSAPPALALGSTRPPGLHRLQRRVDRPHLSDRGGPDSLLWFWSLAVNGPMTRSDRVATLEEGQGTVSEELGRLEGVGEAGRDRA
jgi:hypothetical protein